MRAKWIVSCLAVVGWAAAHAEVTNAQPHGFTLRHIVDVPKISAPSAWAAVSDIAKWWDPDHTYSGDARNMSLDPVVGGCFCEKLGLYAGIEHARVVYAEPTKALRLIGSLGPLQEFGVTGSMTWTFAALEDGSRITFTYNVGGYADRPLSDWAPLVDEVLGHQLARLSRYLTTGSPDAEPQAEP